MTKLYLRDILRLDAVDSEAYHEVRDDLRLLFGISDDLYCLVDIEKYFFKSAQQMQLVLSFFEVKISSASDALHAERKSFCMSLSGSVPLFKSMVILRPLLSVSSRISLISLIAPALTLSITFSIIDSLVAVEVIGISVISMQFFDLS